MFAQVPLFPERASEMAENVDLFFFFMLTVTGAVAVLVSVLVIGFAIHFRRRGEDEITPRITGSKRLEIFWSVVPLFFFLVMFGWGASLFFAQARAPADAIEVYVVGKQWMWKLQHPDGQREINTLHVPVNQAVKLTLTSEDVIHNFGLPAFRTKIDVLPGRYVSTWIQPNRVGRFHIFCDQYCGTSHSNMVGQVIVMEADEYADWLNSHADGSLALEGRKLFLKLQCISCHSSNAVARAPVLEGLFGRAVTLQDGRSVVADESYIRKSILFPRVDVVQGWEPIMPTFKGQVNEEELIQLVAYIKSLKPGQTPVRTDQFPAPVGAPTTPPKGSQP
jgi:cytochrome c oxidase subunit 2